MVLDRSFQNGYGPSVPRTRELDADHAPGAPAPDHLEPDRPRAVLWIAVLTAFTITRMSVAFRLPSLEMFDGDNPDAWIGPWVSDAVLGLLVPVMVYLAWRTTGTKVWGALVAYTVIGAFDYAHGLVTQRIHPLNANSTVTYGAIGFFMALQLVVAALLFRDDVVRHYVAGDPKQTVRSRTA